MSESTVQKGNSFRDAVCKLLSAAGFREVITEVRMESKKVDGYAEWLSETPMGRMRIIIEAKDYESTFTKKDVLPFVSEYSIPINKGDVDFAWLITKGPISADARKFVEDSNRKMKCLTFESLQRQLFNIDGYLDDLIKKYAEDRIGDFYVPARSDQNGDAEAEVTAWLLKPNASPLAIIGSYGRGKTTFARHLAVRMATEALDNPTVRAPLLIPLGEIVDEQDVSGLVSKFFASQHRVTNYHYHLFEELNRAGRFLIIFDGLDEMKHGMTFPRFQQTVDRLLELDKGDARILLLGRDTVFRTDREFAAIVGGLQTTAGGQDVPIKGRRTWEVISLRDFTLNEARDFVRRYFPVAAERFARERDIALNPRWIEQRRTELLDNRFDELLVRPVHAQMLCDIATDPSANLAGVNTYSLYDRFVHYLVEREVRKPGRYDKFDGPIRRRFNSEVAWWLWEKGQASTTTLADVPNAICRRVVDGIDHDLDDAGLSSELAAGCLVNKGGSTIYFGHRSIQEFLVAEHIFDTSLLARADGQRYLETLWPFLTGAVPEFIIERLKSAPKPVETARDWLHSLERLIGNLPPSNEAVKFFADVYSVAQIPVADVWKSPWNISLGFVAANNGVEYRPNAGALRFARALLEFGSSNKRVLSTAIYIWSRIFGETGLSHTGDLAVFLAKFAQPTIIAAAIREIAANRNYTATIREDTNFLLWLFLTSTSINRDPASRELHIDVNLSKLTDGIMSTAHIVDYAIPVGPIISVPVQAVYQAIGMNSRELDGIRPFFNDERVRDRIKPLVVEIRVRPSRRR